MVCVDIELIVISSFILSFAGTCLIFPNYMHSPSQGFSS